MVNSSARSARHTFSLSATSWAMASASTQAMPRRSSDSPTVRFSGSGLTGQADHHGILLHDSPSQGSVQIDKLERGRPDQAVVDRQPHPIGGRTADIDFPGTQIIKFPEQPEQLPGLHD